MTRERWNVMTMVTYLLSAIAENLGKVFAL